MADIESNIKVNIDTSDALSQLKLLQQQISAFQQGMKNAGAQNAAAAQAMQQNLMSAINATGKFTANIQTIKTSAESFTESLEKNKLSIGQYFKYAGGASKTFGKLFKSEFETIQQVAVDRVKTIQTQYIKLGRDASGAMKAIAVRPLALDMDNLGTKTQIAAQKQQLFNQLMKQGSTQLLNFGKNTQWAGRQLMVGFTIPLTLMGQAAAQAYMKIEAASLKFRRVYGDMNTTTEQANKMVKSVQALANEFTKYGVAVADTMEMAASAAAMGKTGADLMQQVAQASKLAVLGQVEQQQALETTISLTNTFSVSTEELAKSIDFLNAVENQTVVSIEDLTIAIPKAAPVVKQLGGDVEDLTFFLTAMKEGGINASEGANALKSGLASLINPTKKASDFLEKFGVNVQGIVEGNKGDIKGTVIDFAKALDTLDPLNRARAIEQMFGKFQFSRLSTLFKNVIDEGSQAATVAGLSKQTAEELAILSEREMKKISDSPMFKFQKSIQDMQAKLAPVGEAFLKAVTPIIEFVTKILDGFNNLSDGTKSFVSILTLAVAGIGPVLLMTFGLIANGVANIMKLFTNMKSFINKTTKPSDILGEQTSYMNTEQLKSAAIAASLDQAHAKLRQTFTSEAAAVQQLTDAYRNAVQAQQAYSGVPGIQVGNPNATPKKYANGVSMVPGPAGAGDIVPALLSPGEAVIPARSAKKYAPVIRGMISGNLPGFEKGTAGVGMRQSIIGPLNEKQTEGIIKTGKTMKEISDEVAAGPYGQTPPTNYGTQISPTTGHSFPAFGVGGVYEKPDGTKVFVKPQMDLVGAMAEMRGTQIARDAHGLISPEQALRVMMDPTDPENKRKFLVLESALDERLANAPKTFTKDQYFKQLVASLLRGDKDLGVGNLGGDVLADVGTAGVFKTASGKRQLGGQINSMEEQAIINLLGVKGGAKKFFAESTANIAKSMTPAEYDAAMKAEIQAVMPRLQATIAGFGNLSPEEKKAYMDMQQRLQAGLGVDWSKYQFMHAAVKPKEYALGTHSVSAEDYKSKSQADREDLYKKNVGRVDDGDINKYIGLQDTHIVSAISSPAKGGKPREGDITDEQLAMLSQVIGSPIDRTKLEASGFELLANATARMSTKVNQKIKKGNSGMDGADFARAWKMFGGKFSKLSLVAGASRGLTQDDLFGAITKLDEGIISETNKKGTIVSDQSLATIVDRILQSDTNLFAPIIEQRNRIATMRAPLVDDAEGGNEDDGKRKRQSHEQAYELLMSGQGTLTASGGTISSDIFVNDQKDISTSVLNKARISMTNTDSFEPGKKWWKGNPEVEKLIKQGLANKKNAKSSPDDLEMLPDKQISGMGHYIKHILAERAREVMKKKESQDILKKARETGEDVRPQVTLGYTSPTLGVYKEIEEQLQTHGMVLESKKQKDDDDESAGDFNPHRTFVEKEILKRIERGSKVMGDFPFRGRGIAPGGLSIPKQIPKDKDGKEIFKDGKRVEIPAQPTYDAKSVHKGGNVVRLVDSGMGAISDYKFLKDKLLFKGENPQESTNNANMFFENVARYAAGGIVPEGKSKPKASVFDVDDTLLDLASFMPAHQERNAKLPKEQRLNWWEEVAKDPKGIPAAIQKLKEAQMRGNKILLMTARPKSYDEVTIDTLRKLGIDMNGVKLISRENKDYRKPEQMKYDKTSKYRQWYDIEEFYDDLAKTRGAVGLMGINAIDPLKLAMGSVKVPGYADGVFSVPGPKGAGDVVPAMLSPGEAVIPAKQAARHRPMIKQMIAGNLPGYNKGTAKVPGYVLGTDKVKNDDSWDWNSTQTKTTVAEPKVSSIGMKVLEKLESVFTKIYNNPLFGKFADKMAGIKTDADGNILAKEQEAQLDEEGNIIKKKKEITKLTREQIEEQLATIDPSYQQLLEEQKKLKVLHVLDDEQKAKLQKLDQEILQKEQAFMAKAGVEEKKKSGLFTRTATTGKIQSAAYGATGVAGALSAMPGDIGKAAQAAMPAIGAMTGAMSMIPGPAGIAVGAIMAAFTVFQQLEAHFKALREEAAKATKSMGASVQAMAKLSEFSKKVGSREIMDKRRDESASSFFFIKPGKKTFGESYMESEAGKDLATETSKAVKAGDIKSAAALVTSQMGTAIAQGILSPAQARSVVSNLAKQIKNTSFGIDVNAKITTMFGPDGSPLEVSKNTIKLSLDAVTTISAAGGGTGDFGSEDAKARGAGAVTESTVAAMNSIQSAMDALALNPKATQKDKDDLTAMAQQTISQLYDNVVAQKDNTGNMSAAAITSVEEAYKGTGSEDLAKSVAQQVKDNSKFNDQQEIFLNQMVASKVVGPTQMQTAMNLGVEGTQMIDLLKTNPTALNQLLDIASSMTPAMGSNFMQSQVGKSSQDMAATASALQLTKKTTGVYDMDAASQEKINLFYATEGLDKAKMIDKEFQALNAKKEITLSTILDVSGNNTELKKALEDGSGNFTKYFNKFKDKKNKLIFTTQFNSLVNLGTDELAGAIKAYLSEKGRISDMAGKSNEQIVQTFKVEYAAYEANRVTESGALQDLTPSPGDEGGGEKEAPQASILDQYVKMLREGANYAQKLTVGWTASYNALSKYGTKAINQMAGIASLMKQYGGDAGIINDFLGGTEEEQNRIIDKTTGKLKAGAGQLIAKLKQIKDMQEFGLSYVLASPAERMAKDNELYQAGLEVISNKEKKINDKYDKRVKALDEIGKIQEKNNQRQQDTLTLADALSKGDIAAAARAAMTAKQNSQKLALEDAKESIELARKNELEKITTTILGKTVTRAELEDQIAVNSGKIAEHKRIELNRQIEIGKNALIAAKASADQLRNGKAIAGLPKGGGSGSGDGSGTDTNPKDTKNTKVPKAPAATPEEIATLTQASSKAGLSAAKNAATAKSNQAQVAAVSKYGIDAQSLKIAVNKGNSQAIYGSIKEKDRAQFTKDFANLVTLDKKADEYDQGNSSNIQDSVAGQAAAAALEAVLSEATKANLNLLRTRQTDYKTDLTEYLAKQQAYKDAAGKLGLGNTPWKDISPENKAKLQSLYDPYSAMVSKMFNRKKATDAAHDALEKENPDYNYWFQFDGINSWGKTDIAGKEVRDWKKYASGGMVVPKGYARGGGIYGTDTVPAMLTPGEFVIRKSAVDRIGSSKLNSMNSGNTGSDSVYNYSITLNVNSSSDSNDIADAVLRQIKRIDSQRIRSSAI